MSTELHSLQRDLRRYFVLADNPSAFQKLRLVLATEGIWFAISFRLGRWVRRDLRIPIVKQLLHILTGLVHFAVSVVTKIDISLDGQVGGGLYLGHSGYVIVNTGATIGENCNLSPGVVIGEGGRGGDRGSPVIGNNVYIGPGAKIFGALVIGDNVAVGANAVVNTSVPANAVVGGIPAKILSYRGATDFVIVDPVDSTRSAAQIRPSTSAPANHRVVRNQH